MWELQLLEGAFYQLSGSVDCMMLSKMLSAHTALNIVSQSLGKEKWTVHGMLEVAARLLGGARSLGLRCLCSPFG